MALGRGLPSPPIRFLAPFGLCFRGRNGLCVATDNTLKVSGTFAGRAWPFTFRRAAAVPAHYFCDCASWPSSKDAWVAGLFYPPTPCPGSSDYIGDHALGYRREPPIVTNNQIFSRDARDFRPNAHEQNDASN